MNCTATWLDQNQRYLGAALEAVRSRVEAIGNGEAPAVMMLPEPPAELYPPPALATLATTFRLNLFEQTVLLLCAGLELDAGFAATFRKVHGAAEATFGMGLALLPAGPWSSLGPQAPLRRWRMVELRGSGALNETPLRIDERVLHHLAGIDYLDQRLEGIIALVEQADPPAQSHQVISDAVATALHPQSAGVWPEIQLCGGDGPVRAAVAAHACAALGLRMYRIAVADIPHAAAERHTLARLIDRELALSAGVLLVQDDGPAAGDPHHDSAVRLVDAIVGPVILSGSDPLPGEQRRRVRFDLPAVGFAERRSLWQVALGDGAIGQDGILDRITAQFMLDGSGVRAAAAAARGAGLNGSAVLPDPDRLWEACRVQARQRLDQLAERIESGAGWEDLVLPEEQTRQLREVAMHVRRQHRVHVEWGWAAKGNRGLGIAALFAGPSGTGKTLAAEVLANDLRLDLYRIDLSQVVSKYIGETEKNLRRIFAAAEDGGALLLFDEADALFGKRTEVKDSHDRYANVEVSYLLQRMEAYRGLAILTTNMKSALDPAFLRRLRFVVQFPFPDAASRASIWHRIFPADTPVAPLDIERLSRLTIAGGNIRSIAMNASFLAAEAGSQVTAEHVMAAARQEYAKLEKPVGSGELRG